MKPEAQAIRANIGAVKSDAEHLQQKIADKAKRDPRRLVLQKRVTPVKGR